MKAEGTAEDYDAITLLTTCVLPRAVTLVELTTPQASE